MQPSQVLEHAYQRITQVVRQSLDGLAADALTWQPEPDANHIGWLVWHLTRIQDDHIAELAERPQVWQQNDWPTRFGFASDTLETGHGHTAAQVAALRPESVTTLLDYHERVASGTQAFLGSLTAEDLDRIIDTSYDPPVTMGVRLVSVIADNLQHAGQARYLRGIYERTVDPAN
ncbi:MAG: DinB family protein [Nitriliruptoraceae bacterium]